MNTVKVTLLLTTLTLLLVLVGGQLGGTGGMVLALGFAVVMNLGTYWFSDKLALSMTGAKEVSYAEAPELHRIVDRLAAQGRIPKPRVYVVESMAPNAFATGRGPGNASIAVTTGLVRLLNRDELAGVIAHELAHVRNRDTLISAIVATVAGAITMIANIAQWSLIFGGLGRGDDDDGGGLAGLAGSLVMIIVAPIAALLIQLAISRSREFTADETGARIMGDSLPLASALEKLHSANQVIPMKVSPATAHQFTVQPLAGGGLMGLFSTHPNIEERVARLRDMALRPLALQDWSR
jgi:heat shock protein HtpX